MDIFDLIDLYNGAESEKDTAKCMSLADGNYKSFLANIDKVISERKIIYAILILSRKKKAAEYIAKDGSLLSRIKDHTNSDDGKVRKNAYSAMYNIGAEKEEFFDGLKREETNYVIAHIVKLLLKKDRNNVFELKSLSKKWDLTDKHIKEAIGEINKVLEIKKGNNGKRLYMKRICAGDKLLLTCPKIGVDALRNDALHIFDNVVKTKNGVIVEDLKDINDLNSIRTFNDAFIIVEGLIDVRTSFGEFCGMLADLLHKEEILFRFGIEDRVIDYRIEYDAKSSFEDRISKTQAIARELDKKEGFRNSADNYFLLIKVDEKDGVLSAYIACSFYDVRFSYRKNKLPASVNPVTANIVSALAERYIIGKERVLDCFLGTGTMLIEFIKRYSPKLAVGADIERKAIAMAKENFALADIAAKTRFYVCDAAKFDCGETFDVIVSNLPFGTRVLRHDAVKLLYKNFARNLRSLLSDDGIAILLTTDGKDLRNELVANSMDISAEFRIESGGLIPFVFIVSK